MERSGQGAKNKPTLDAQRFVIKAAALHVRKAAQHRLDQGAL
jgi:hypothetical protein